MDAQAILGSNNPLEVFLLSAGAILIITLLVIFLIRSLRRGEKLRYDFITIIAHKFRTPLSQIKWSLGELITAEQEPFTKQSMVEMQQANENLIRLTGTLIALADSSGASGNLYHIETVNLCEIARQCGETLKKSFHEKNLFFSVQCADNEIHVKADRALLEFAVQTVMENACAYSPDGRNVEIIVARKGKKAVVSVTDHGIGMSRIELARLFSKFFRSKSAAAMDTEGFGVGLYLTRSIIKNLRGSIKAFSEGRDKGSTFVITLPAIKK
jgi:signal transduction histidine kinase